MDSVAVNGALLGAKGTPEGPRPVTLPEATPGVLKGVLDFAALGTRTLGTANVARSLSDAHCSLGAALPYWPMSSGS